MGWTNAAIVQMAMHPISTAGPTDAVGKKEAADKIPIHKSPLIKISEKNSYK